MRFISVFLWLLTIAAQAQAACTGDNLINALPASDQRALEARVAAHPYPNGNLWRATRGASTFHVIGTMHVDDPALRPFVKRLRGIVTGADSIWFESDRADMQALQARMAGDPSLMFLQSGPTLIDLLPPGDWYELSGRLSERGIPGFMAAKMQPWYAALMLSVPACAIEALARPDGLDFRLMDIAEGAGVPTRSLEDPQTALRLLAGDPLEDQLDMLSAGLAMSLDEGANFVTMRDSYIAGAHRELWEFMVMQASRDPARSPAEWAALLDEMEQDLLIRRNREWVETVLSESPAGSHVIAVGAAHLSGDDGVLNLLDRAGYTLERLE